MKEKFAVWFDSGQAGTKDVSSASFEPLHDEIKQKGSRNFLN